jgi:hypothetical protein
VVAAEGGGHRRLAAPHDEPGAYLHAPAVYSFLLANPGCQRLPESWGSRLGARGGSTNSARASPFLCAGAG